ncbi:electron transfer flavoprotein-ubiquinone oxidoreductase-domain-containing protein, partial [Trametes maxima]
PLGVLGGVVYSSIDTLLCGRTPWTFWNTSGQSDVAHTRRASGRTPITYLPFDSPLSTDILTSVALTGTNHDEDQPLHLRIRRYLQAGEDAGTEGTEPSNGLATERWVEDAAIRWEHVHVNVEEHAGLLGRGCPAQVYEYIDGEGTSVASPCRYSDDVSHRVLNALVRYKRMIYAT